MSSDVLRQRTEAFLKSPPNNLPVAVPAAPSALESMGAAAPIVKDFSVFIPSHAERALELAARFMEIANATPGDQGLMAVLDEADRVAALEDDRMVKYALMVFITHHPEGR